MLVGELNVCVDQAIHNGVQLGHLWYAILVTFHMVNWTWHMICLD